MNSERAKRAVEAALASYPRQADVEVRDEAVYVWLTPLRQEGPHVLVTASPEGSVDGFLICGYLEDCEPMEDAATSASYHGAGRAVVRLVGELSAFV